MRKLDSFQELITIMDRLREECPWDKKQTLESLRTLTIEECFELADAISEKNLEEVKKELGDLLLHIVFYAKIGEEKKAFNLDEICKSINNKLIYRHPHIFSDTKVSNSKEVEENWEKLKLKEKNGNKSVLSGVPKSLPALIKAQRIQDKARGVGFDWEEKEHVWTKVEEEYSELKEEIANASREKMEEEFGDLLFSLVNAARLYDINPENALEKTNKKFTKRFNYMEEKTLKKGVNLKDMSLEEMDKIWDEAKKQEL
ncbi:MAG: nucleoside triphosphate pyrophosphohydrolase [Marinifilaceae bacterium]|jgi:XTP/dITP diphosphohydrolase|nr:nucleoside triphosphate pyrophosphohydrolase [Marinifilaceae bacterium]